MNKNKPQIIRHGEVIMKPVSTLPQGMKLEKEVKSHIVAHSETGHHHVLESIDFLKIYQGKGETFIELTKEGNLRHEKTGKDVHTPHKVAPAIYQIVIKKEFDYFQGALRAVRD